MVWNKICDKLQQEFRTITLISELYRLIGIESGSHILMHSSYKKILSAFSNLTIERVIRSLQNQLTDSGSLIMPSFTYCFKRRQTDYEVYCKELSPSRTGIITEYFRQMPGVIRTSSPTHSFLLSGNVLRFIGPDNSPDSPLGSGSVLEWMANQSNSFVLMLGTNFSSLSFGHYLEVIAPVPWSDISPWDYLQVEKSGVAVTGEQTLKEVPGCAKQFISFQEYLITKGLLKVFNHNGLEVLFIPVSLLIQEGVPYFRNNFYKLLCPLDTCPACDTRRNQMRLVFRKSNYL